MNYEQLEGDGAAAQAEAEHQNWLAEQKLEVLYFSAPWCGPCKMFKPAFIDVTTQFGESINVEMIDIDERPVAAKSFEVTSIPTVILKRGNEILFRQIGVMAKNQLKELIEKHK